MKILILSPYPHFIMATLQGEQTMVTMESPETWPDADWLISFGYRYLIGPVTLHKYGNRAINIHLSILPYNRGADPNFWSWFDRTPKGISIHRMEHGLDTGPVFGMAETKFSPTRDHTLKTSYETLQRTASLYFDVLWPSIRDNKLEPFKQSKSGTYHRLRDKEEYFSQLSAGWDTPVREVEELGRKIRGQTIGSIPSGRRIKLVAEKPQETRETTRPSS